MTTDQPPAPSERPAAASEDPLGAAPVPPAPPGLELFKRAVDLVVGCLGTVMTMPLVITFALAIRLESPGDPIFRQERVGRHGRPFTMFKLRTMVQAAERIGSGYAIAAGDARITRVGAFLRRTSLDELPNLWNIARGEMSLVGPRPTLAYQVAQYTPRQRGRLAVKPGLTGWAQLHGRAAVPWAERIELDLWYVEHRSIALELEIMRRTVGLVLRGEESYTSGHGGWAPPPGEDEA